MPPNSFWTFLQVHQFVDVLIFSVLPQLFLILGLVVTQNDTQFVFLSETLKHHTYLREPSLCLTCTDYFLLIQAFQQFQNFLQQHLFRLLFRWSFRSSPPSTIYCMRFTKSIIKASRNVTQRLG